MQEIYNSAVKSVTDMWQCKYNRWFWFVILTIIIALLAVGCGSSTPNPDRNGDGIPDPFSESRDDIYSVTDVFVGHIYGEPGDQGRDEASSNTSWHGVELGSGAVYGLYDSNDRVVADLRSGECITFWIVETYKIDKVWGTNRTNQCD